MEALLPDFYYSPKTYGLEGLNYKGFEVDQLFTAGANIATPDDLPNSTFGIFTYHIKRSLLTAILGVYASVDDDAINKSDSSLLTVIIQASSFMSMIVSLISSLSDFRRWVIASMQGAFNRSTTMVQNITVKLPFFGPKIVSIAHYISEFISLAFSNAFPKQKYESVSAIAGPVVSLQNIALVVHSNEFVAPPPPNIPSPQEKAAMPHEALTELYNEVQLYSETEAVFTRVETRRVIEEAATLIHWAFVLNLQHITLCEELGYLSGNAAELIEAVKVVFEKAHEKLPQMTFVVPSQESVYDVSNTCNPTVSRPLSSSSTLERSRPTSYGSAGIVSGGIRRMKIVVLDCKNGKRLTLKGLRSACALVQKKMLEPENVARSVESFMEQYGITDFDLVVSAGPSLFEWASAFICEEVLYVSLQGQGFEQVDYQYSFECHSVLCEEGFWRGFMIR